MLEYVEDASCSALFFSSFISQLQKQSSSLHINDRAMAVKAAPASAMPKLDAVGERLEHFIQDSLDKYQFRNAIFLAERLCSHVRVPGHSEEEREYARFLLATSHYRHGDPVLAWSILQESSSTRGCFLFAQCCLDLRRYIECTDVLERLLESNNFVACTEIGTTRR